MNKIPAKMVQEEREITATSIALPWISFQCGIQDQLPKARDCVSGFMVLRRRCHSISMESGLLPSLAARQSSRPLERAYSQVLLPLRNPPTPHRQILLDEVVARSRSIALHTDGCLC